MKHFGKIHLTLTSIFLLLSSTFSFGQEVAAAEETEAVAQQVVEQKIHEKIGLSGTAMFFLMTGITILLAIFLLVLGRSFKTVVEKYGDEIDKGAKVIAALFLFSSPSVFAAEQATSSPQMGMVFTDGMFWGFIAIDFIILGVAWYIWHHMKKFLPDYAKPKPIFKWKRISRELTDAVPVEEEESIEMDHEYDGIRELDNNLPPWWKYGFYITIVWAFGYLLYYNVLGIGPLQHEEFKQEWEEGERAVAEYKKAHPELITAENVVLLEDPASLAQGKRVYDERCASCHMEGGRGGVGPNLTDKHWIYDGDIKGVFASVSEGRENGMVAWKEFLSADKIQQVSSYVLSLEYIAPPGGKEPQGENIKE